MEPEPAPYTEPAPVVVVEPEPAPYTEPAPVVVVEPESAPEPVPAQPVREVYRDGEDPHVTRIDDGKKLVI